MPAPRTKETQGIVATESRHTVEGMVGQCGVRHLITLAGSYGVCIVVFFCQQLRIKLIKVRCEVTFLLGAENCHHAVLLDLICVAACNGCRGTNCLYRHQREQQG